MGWRCWSKPDQGGALEYQTTELELYHVGGEEPQNDILKVGLNDQICTWKRGLSGCHVECGVKGQEWSRELHDKVK